MLYNSVVANSTDWGGGIVSKLKFCLPSNNLMCPFCTSVSKNKDNMALNEKEREIKNICKHRVVDIIIVVEIT